MALILFHCAGGEIVLPNANLVLVSREDGGNLIVNPPREVWERGELTGEELTRWSFLVAAAGSAMLQTLPQLENGCINYWEAGNWALSTEAEPLGVKKSGPVHRKVHLHLLGRSRDARSPSHRWGEAPRFPSFAERHAWAAQHQRLTAEECCKIIARAENLLKEKYGMPAAAIFSWQRCTQCKYPCRTTTGAKDARCNECESTA